jgi:RNA polymerase sigma factor (sigma-70 family)
VIEESEEDRPVEENEQRATIEEACEAIRCLTAADHAKLMIIARIFAYRRTQGSVIEAEDLLHEAIVRTATGDKKWNRKVSIVKHLDRAMENLSGHAVKKARRTESFEAGGFDLATESEPIDSQMIVNEQLETVLPRLEKDEVALQVLRLKADDFSPSEIQAKLGISEREYETVSRRIRRLREKLPRGG